MATSMGEEEVVSSRESLEFLDLWEALESSSSLCTGECVGEPLRWLDSEVKADCKSLGLLVLEEDDSKVSLEEVLESASVALEVTGIC